MIKLLKNAFSKAKSKTALVATGAMTMTVANPSFAAGLAKVSTLANNIKDALTTIGVVVVTISILVAGYKIIFQGQTFREVAPILVGGIIIGAASEIASLLVG